MTKISFKIIAYASSDHKAAIVLREEILRKPLGLTFLPKEIEKEKDHIIIAGFKGKEVVATAVLVPEGKACKVQRVAVIHKLQNTGIGKNLMAYCEKYAKSHGFISIYCHARDSAVKFYKKINYVTEGDYFDEDSIPHLKMRKHLLLKILKSKSNEKNVIINNIVEFNRQKLGYSLNDPTSRLLNYHIKVEGSVIAGINSILYFKFSVLFINQLYVDEAYRHLRLGSTLLENVESEAKKYECKLVHLDTFDWQAKDFYTLHGYEVFGILDDCPEGHKRYFLKKKL